MYYVGRFALVGVFMAFCMSLSVWNYRGMVSRDLASVGYDYSSPNQVKFNPRFHYDATFKY